MFSVFCDRRRKKGEQMNSIKISKRIGIAKRDELRGKAMMILARYSTAFPELIDETKRKWIFSKNGAEIHIPKKLMAEFKLQDSAGKHNGVAIYRQTITKRKF